MKFFEITIENDGKINLRRENDQQMKPEQRYNLMMAAIIATAACIVALAFFRLLI